MATVATLLAPEIQLVFPLIAQNRFEMPLDWI